MLGAGTVAGAVGVAVASRRWHADTERVVGELTRSTAGLYQRVRFDALATLPAPARRYFRLVLRDGQPYIRRAFVTQVGEFRSKESEIEAAGWQPFSATQVFITRPPGFVWDARIRMAPLTQVWVRDAYVRGRASMLGALMGTLPVAKEMDAPGLRAGALQRYLAEAVWFPTALLPESGVIWSAIDDAHASATLSDGATTVSLEFSFAKGGEIVACSTPGRPRAEPGKKGRYVTLPWGGRYHQYREHGGMRVPAESEVYWVIRGQEQTYYRGRNLLFEYDFHGEDRP